MAPLLLYGPGMILIFEDDHGSSGFALRKEPGQLEARINDVRRLTRTTPEKAAKIAVLRSLVDPTPVPLRKAG